MKIIPRKTKPLDATPVRKESLEMAAYIAKSNNCLFEPHPNSDIAFLMKKVDGKYVTVLDFTISAEDWLAFDITGEPLKFTDSFAKTNYTYCDGSALS